MKIEKYLLFSYHFLKTLVYLRVLCLNVRVVFFEMANNTHYANDYHQPTPCILVMDWIPKIQVGANFLMMNLISAMENLKKYI